MSITPAYATPPERKRLIMLWSTPRSASTAFEKAFMQRGDTVVVHEPFTDCYYFGQKRRSTRYGDNSNHEDLDGRSAEKAILSACGPVVFVKELAFQAYPYLDAEFLRSATHTFLVRDPLEVYASLVELKPDFTEEEFGFEPLWALYRLVTETMGRPAVAVESNSFRRAPREALLGYCDRVGLEFDSSMLRWAPGPIRQWQPHERESQAKWHRKLESSEGVLPPNSLPVEPTPERWPILERAQQIYWRFRGVFI